MGQAELLVSEMTLSTCPLFLGFLEFVYGVCFWRLLLEFVIGVCFCLLFLDLFWTLFLDVVFTLDTTDKR